MAEPTTDDLRHLAEDLRQNEHLPDSEWVSWAADRIDAQSTEIEQLQEAVHKHFALLHDVVPWTHVILNGDGEFQTVVELMDGDQVVVER